MGVFVFVPDLKVLRIEDDLSSDLRIDEEFIVLSSFGNSENIRENISSCIPNIFNGFSMIIRINVIIDDFYLQQ